MQQTGAKADPRPAEAQREPLQPLPAAAEATRSDEQRPRDAALPAASSTVVEPTTEELRLSYRIAIRSRALESSIVRLASRGEVKFSICGTGEEVHGVAAALALSKVVTLGKFAMMPHYRSSCLHAMWCELNGYETYDLDLLRQQLSRDTDPWSRGRQMVHHVDMPEIGVLAFQAPVGLQLGKVAGYAMGFKLKGLTDTVSLVAIGDGTTAEGDLHEAMNAASVWQLPLIIMIDDNNIAISTLPEEGRGIKDFAAYAEAFGIDHLECDGRDFWEVFRTTEAAARHVRETQTPILVHVKDLPRLNGHSSAADMTFDLSQHDPLLDFGTQLVDRGVLGDADILKRKPGKGRDFFAHHIPGATMEREIEEIRQVIDQVRREPEPPAESVMENIHPPFPAVSEIPTTGETQITYAGAVRAALDRIIEDYGGVIWGQDVARLGGVMTATAGLKAKHPKRIFDSPLNEPLIVGTACGASLHDGIVAVPEIQFGDYSLNAFHWLVHMGNNYWATNGSSRFAVVLRIPVDPFGGGAVYHSMSLDGYFASIPGLVILMPCTSYDVYGLLLAAAEYHGPVVVLEPKWLYRLAKGPAFPGEPADPETINRLRKRILRGEIPEIDPNIRIPFGKAATRRQGDDLTIVAWGRAVWTVMEASAELAGAGIEAEIIDLRTLVPPDLDCVLESVARTRRLLVAAEDRPFAGFVRAIQGAVVERFQGIPTRAIGQKNIPGVGQSSVLEAATILKQADVVAAAREVMESSESDPRGWSWIPPRYLHG